MSVRSLMYRSPALYTSAMRVIYWPHFEDRYRVVADLVPRGASVVDLCCGDAYLYRHYLRDKGVRYLGLDSSKQMIRAIKREGVRARVWDARYQAIPAADYVIMQGSLCHFLPDVEPILERMRRAARYQVIVSEPIREHARPALRSAAFLSRLFTTPENDDGSYQGERFTEASFTALTKGNPTLLDLAMVPGNRDMVAVFQGSGECPKSSDRPGKKPFPEVVISRSAQPLDASY